MLAAGMGGFLRAELLKNAVAKEVVKARENAASRSVSIYNPTKKPPRPFEADYPNGAPANAEGRLTHDIEGRPLTGRYIVGRNMEGDDQAFPATEFNALAEATTGRRAQALPPRQMGQDAGRTILNKYSRRPLGIDLRAGLSPETSQRVYGHELGHVIDEFTGQIPTNGLNKQLRGVYNTLNNGNRTPDGTDAAPWSKPATPQEFGYKSADVPREHMAEAIRAYMADPNYLKTVAPDVAARIRSAVNSHPELSKIIQFNAAPPVPVAPWNDDPIVAPAKETYVSPFANWFGGPEA